jgi:ABC-type polysaccharide/polyol phosphate export permease
MLSKDLHPMQLRTRIAVDDMTRGLHDFSLAAYLAWGDIRQRYVRTMLGPLWITLSTGILFSAMGFVMANLFRQDMSQYLPFLIAGLLVWGLISTAISDGAQVLISSAPLITSFSLPVFLHYIRFILRNYIIFFHNLIVLAIVFLIFPPPLTSATFLLIPGFALDMLILTGFAISLSLVNLRYRDTSLAVNSALQVLPFVTPIFWNRDMLSQHRWIADINPFYHMVQIMRAPLLGQAPSPASWIITLFLAAASSALAVYLFARYRHRVVFWL